MESTDPLVVYLNSCVVRIDCDGTFRGTGFFVGPGLVLTCAHSFQDGEVITILTDEGVTCDAARIFRTEHTESLPNPFAQPDAVILKINNPPPNHPCVNLESADPVIGSDLLILTAYAKGENDPDEIARSGAVLHLESRFQQAGYGLYKFSRGQIVRGFSGGPVMNLRTGRVIAMVDSSRSIKADLGGFGVPIGLVAAVEPALLAINTEFHLIDRRWARAKQEQERQLFRSSLENNSARKYSGTEERRVMLRRVYNKWIRDVLETASTDSTRVQLYVQRRAKTIYSQHEEPPVTASLLGFLEEASEAMVLLGGVGAGKTTLLIELMRDIIERAEIFPNVPIPILLSLSSWRPSPPLRLEDWVVSQLQETYGVPASTARRWVAENSLLIIMDGLDELGEAHGQRCIQAIKRYLQDNGPSRIVVACQTDIYDSLSSQLNAEVIVVQPLSREQVSEVRELDPGENDPSSSALRKMQEVFGPIESPLMLNIFIQANKVMHRSQLNVREMSNRQFSDYLYNAYIERMMDRRPGRYGTDLTLKWLRSLANYIDGHGLSEFQLDRITPRWVLRSSAVWMSAVAMGITAGLIAGLLDGIGYGLVHGMQRGIANGIIVGMLFGLFVGLRAYDLTVQPESRNKKRHLFMVASGTIWLAVFSALLLGIKAIAVFPLFFVVAYLVFARFSSTRPVEQVEWSWLPSLKGFFWGFLVGAPCGAIDGVRDNFRTFPILLGFGLAFGCAAGIFGSIAVGLRPKLITARIRPNEGVHRSAMRALAFGVTFTIVGSLAFLVPFTLLARSEVPFGASIRLGLVLGMAASLLGGGLNLLEHITTRIALVITGSAPLNYVRFLNEAVDMQLLYRAGSGYLFRHRSLLTHFSKMTDEDDQFV